MDYSKMKKARLIEEIEALQAKIAELERVGGGRQRAEKKAEHLNLVLRAIRSVNQLIARERDRDRLLQGACDRLIETRGYHNAWIALLDEGRGPVLSEAEGLLTTAEAGLGEEFAPLVERLKRGELTACGRRALSQPGVVVTEDPPSACADCPLAMKYAGRGALTVRLEHGGKVYGLLSASISAHLTADREEQILFGEVAGDIAFALHSIELEEALRESEERFDLAVRGSNAGIWDWDIQNHTLYWSPRLKELLGYADDELDIDFETFESHLHPDDRERTAAAIDAHLRDRGLYEVEQRLRTKSGEYRWFLARGQALWDEAGNPLRMVGSTTDITERKQAEDALRQSHTDLQRALEGTVHALGSAVELRDPYTAGHQQQVSQLACAIAHEMGLPEEQIEGLRLAALIHDMGKMTVPAEILNNPGELNNFQWGLIRAHPQIGYDMLKDLDFPWPLADIVLQHHERLDGSGYPQGLSDGEIMLEARILAVADVVVAMASHRPYRPARGIDEALEEISQNKGVLYDAEAVDACLKLFAEKRFELE